MKLDPIVYGIRCPNAKWVTLEEGAKVPLKTVIAFLQRHPGAREHYSGLYSDEGDADEAWAQRFHAEFNNRSDYVLTTADGKKIKAIFDDINAFVAKEQNGEPTYEEAMRLIEKAIR